MLMNFSPIAMPLPYPYVSQDEIDILVETDRIDDVKHTLAEIERRFSDAALCKSQLL